jgi:hypothetical protein
LSFGLLPPSPCTVGQSEVKKVRRPRASTRASLDRCGQLAHPPAWVVRSQRGDALMCEGFGAPKVAGLVNHGLATLTREQVKASGKGVEMVG